MFSPAAVGFGFVGVPAPSSFAVYWMLVLASVDGWGIDIEGNMIFALMCWAVFYVIAFYAILINREKTKELAKKAD